MKFLWLLLFLLIIGLLGIGYLIMENKRLAVSEYRICHAKVPEEFNGFRIALLTDLHNNRYGRANKRLLRKIHALNPDIICLAGDMITASRPQKNEEELSFLLELAKRYPVYYSLGNHEEKWKCWDEQDTGRLKMAAVSEQVAYRSYCKKQKNSIAFTDFRKQLIDAGVFFLDNSSVKLKKGTASLMITGLSLPLLYYSKKGKGPELSNEALTELIGPAAPDSYRILLAHMPKYFKEYAAWGADLVLSGHVHGGILILPKLGGVISPQYELFPAYDSGYFEEQEAKMLLSRGLGTHTIPIRIFNRPELIGIELTKR